MIETEGIAGLVAAFNKHLHYGPSERVFTSQTHDSPGRITKTSAQGEKSTTTKISLDVRIVVSVEGTLRQIGGL